MPELLIKAVIAITLALIFYTIGVWSEHRAKVLKPVHLVFFWLGLAMDAVGTGMMSKISNQSQSAMMGVHGITGMIAIFLMLIHAVWATIVLARKNEKALHTFHRFSIVVWIIWLIPFVIGMVMGMR